jgi:hypothetical protein
MREEFGNRCLFLMGGLIAYAAVRSLYWAAIRPFWYDELGTVIVAKQGRLATIWEVLRQGVDSNSPIYDLIERLIGNSLRNEQLSYRLPSIFAFCFLLACVFLIVRRRSNERVALTCSLVPLWSVLFVSYATEARGYSLMVAAVAFAVVCYQRAEDLRWAVLLALSLIAAVTFQYYGIIAVVPFAIGEAVFYANTRHVRWRVLAALASAVLPLLLFEQLLSKLKQYYGTHFWSPPRLATVIDAYSWFLQLPAPGGLVIAGILALSLALIVFGKFARPDPESAVTAVVHEMAMVLGFLALPFVCLVVMSVMHGGLVNRYMLPAILGFPLALGYLLPRSKKQLIATVEIVLLVCFAAQEIHFWKEIRNRAASPVTSAEQLIKEAGRADLPVVVSDGQDYLPLAYYASPDWANRLVSLVDLPHAIAYTGADTIERQLLLLRSYLPMNLVRYESFTTQHREFLLYSGGGGWDWWPRRLLAEGDSLQVIAASGRRKVYLVNLR